MPRSKLLLLGKEKDPALRRLFDWLSPTFDVITLWWPMPGRIACDWMISYRYHYKVPADYLIPNAINFHPAPPSHRGVGGPDWAIKEKWPTFGVTAHYMEAAVDAGGIIEARRFNIWPGETVATLNQRAHAHLLALASDVLGEIAAGQIPLIGIERWSGPLHTRQQLDALCAS